MSHDQRPRAPCEHAFECVMYVLLSFKIVVTCLRIHVHLLMFCMFSVFDIYANAMSMELDVDAHCGCHVCMVVGRGS